MPSNDLKLIIGFGIMALFFAGWVAGINHEKKSPRNPKLVVWGWVVGWGLWATLLVVLGQVW